MAGRRRPCWPRARQEGFALLELTLAVALGSMILIWAANRLVHQVDDAAGRAAGVWMLELKRGLDNMLRQHFDSLAEGVPALDANGLPLYADLLAPRLAELKAHGHLPVAFPETGALGGGVAIRILRDARCPGAGCRLDALAYGAGPVLLADGSAPDLMRIGAAIEAAGGYGGTATAARLRGANFDFPNPPMPAMPALAPGTLAVWAGLGTADYDLYVRRHDTRNPQLRGDLSVAGAMSAAGRLHTDEYLSLGGVAVAGAACPGRDGADRPRRQRGRAGLPRRRLGRGAWQFRRRLRPELHPRLLVVFGCQPADRYVFVPERPYTRPGFKRPVGRRRQRYLRLCVRGAGVGLDTEGGQAAGGRPSIIKNSPKFRFVPE